MVANDRTRSPWMDTFRLNKKNFCLLAVVLVMITLFSFMSFENYQKDLILLSTLSKRIYSEIRNVNATSEVPSFIVERVPPKCVHPRLNDSILLPVEIPDFAPRPYEYPLSVCDNPYNIENRNICKIGRNLTFVVLVHSATYHFTRRISMRNTWANRQILHRNDIRIVFMLGRPEKETQQAQIDLENSIYGDIVQGNFIDTYHNLTHKYVLGIRWVVEHCLNTKLVLKIDDDVFVNIFEMIKRSSTFYSIQKRKISCLIRYVMPIQRAGKWKVDNEYFKNMTRYPCAACLGFFVVMTTDTFPDLLEAAKRTPYFWIDDVYVTGLIAKRIGGVTYNRINDLNKEEKQTIRCFEPRNKTCKFMTGGVHSEGKMDMVWHFYLRQYKDMAVKYYTGAQNKAEQSSKPKPKS